jgi:dTDP-4-amino-4,6-dideoxygalactose transaminase
VKELEFKLSKYLNLKESQILLTNNGTIPLQIALKILGNGGEIITTPFSYVATTSAIVWENCKPIFVDVHPEYFTIDETKIEEAITDKTTCILATHVFGNICNVDEIERIAKKFKLKVIYDAAHCFGVRYKGRSIFEYGDISTCSLHATKIFHTGEGGAIFCNDKELFYKIFYHHNFGHKTPTEFLGLGINAKMSELSAAMGLAVLPYIDEILLKRKEIVELYDKYIKHNKKQKIRAFTDWNYSYYPIIFNTEDELLKVISVLNNKNIYPRRYFFPSLNTLPYVEYTYMPISEKISKTILCLPLYHGLNTDSTKEIIRVINSIDKLNYQI